jgi:hypothetical protein
MSTYATKGREHPKKKAKEAWIQPGSYPDKSKQSPSNDCCAKKVLAQPLLKKTGTHLKCKI